MFNFILLYWRILCSCRQRQTNHAMEQGGNQAWQGRWADRLDLDYRYSSGQWIHICWCKQRHSGQFQHRVQSRSWIVLRKICLSWAYDWCNYLAPCNWDQGQNPLQRLHQENCDLQRQACCVATWKNNHLRDPTGRPIWHEIQGTQENKQADWLQQPICYFTKSCIGFRKENLTACLHGNPYKRVDFRIVYQVC